MRSHALVAVIAFGLGIVATLLVKGGRGPDAGREARAPGPPVDPPAREARLREVEAENEKLRARIETLERTPAAKSAEPGAAATETDAPAVPPQQRGPRFVFPATEKGLSVVDWQVTGEAVAKLLPLVSEWSDVAHGRRELRADLISDIYRWVGSIYTEGIKLEQAGVPWSSPSFLANLVHATLREAGQPLDAKQEEALQAVGLRHVEEDARRRAGYGETTPRMRQMVEEARMLDRFFAEVDPILTAAQRAVLYPPGVRGVVDLDVFGNSSVWHEKLGRLKYADRAGLRAAATAKHASALDLRPELLTHLESAVAEWERTLPDAFVLHEADAAAANDVKMESAERVLFAAERQLALYEALLLRAPLLDAERKRILAREEVLVPLLVK